MIIEKERSKQVYELGSRDRILLPVFREELAVSIDGLVL